MYRHTPPVVTGTEWSAIMAVLANAVNNWTDFDAWALSKGFDPLEIPSRRLVAAAWLFLTENMEDEIKENLINSLFEENPVRQVFKPKSESNPKGTAVLSPKEKWRAPEGWVPPGWNESQSYANAKNFMNFNANPK